MRTCTYNTHLLALVLDINTNVSCLFSIILLPQHVTCMILSCQILFPFPVALVLTASCTGLLQNVLDTHPVVEMRLLPYALQPVYMSLYLQQEVKQGQRGHPCLFHCDYANFTIALIWNGYTLISALTQVTLSFISDIKLYEIYILYKLLCCISTVVHLMIDFTWLFVIQGKWWLDSLSVTQ